VIQVRTSIFVSVESGKRIPSALLSVKEEKLSMKKTAFRIPFFVSMVTLVFGFGVGCSHPTAPTNNQSGESIVFSKWTVQVISVPVFVRNYSQASWVDGGGQIKYSNSDDSGGSILNYAETLFDLGKDSTLTLSDSIIGFHFFSGGVVSGFYDFQNTTDSVCLDTRKHIILYLSVDSSCWLDNQFDHDSYGLEYTWRNIPYVIDAKGHLAATLYLDSTNTFGMTYSEGSGTHQSAAQNSQSSTTLEHLLPPADSSRIIIRTQQ